MNNMQITRLLMIETGTYNDLVMRPYTTNVSTSTLASFQEATHHGQYLTPAHLSGISGQIMRPSTESLGTVVIPNGFNTRRFRFMMEVVNYFGNEFSQFGNVQYLCGYTDHADVSHGLHIDPRMHLYFNSSVTTRKYEKMTPTGVMTVTSKADASHILVNRSEQNFGFGQHNRNMHLMRPQDICYSMSLAASPNRSDDSADLRSMFRPGILQKSSRENTNTGMYLSKVLTTLRNTIENPKSDGDFTEIAAEAGTAVRDNLVAADPFLGGLLNNRNTSFIEGGSITYGELCQLSPGLDQGDVVQVLLRRNNISGFKDIAERGDSEHWGGTSNETIMSTIVSQSVPALMSELMLTKIAFLATNQTMDGNFHVQVVGGESFMENVDLSPYLMSFQNRLIVEVLADLSRNNLIQIDLQCEIDLLGDTKINISTMGGPMVPYVMPSFCDALSVPVVSPGARNLHVVSHDIGVLSDNLSVDHSIGAGWNSHGGGYSNPTGFGGGGGFDSGNFGGNNFGGNFGFNNGTRHEHPSLL